jgi:hydrogenase-4 component F
MLIALIVIPLLAAVVAFLWRGGVGAQALLGLTAVAHAALSAAAWFYRPAAILDGWVELDTTGLIFLSIVSALFLASAMYSIGYLARERTARHIDREEHIYFTNEPERIFAGCMLLFLASMTLVTVSQNFGLLWVAVEATTLASAPLIYFHRHHRSLEATWKYLLICSVGIALALLGTFLLAVSTLGDGTQVARLVRADLIREAARLDPRWLELAFMLLLVGYGTKMGLAPLHTWLPDAHSEAPSAVSALLSGALLNCAFLGILRAHQVCVAAGLAKFSQNLLLTFGLLSMLVAAVFIRGQTDFKRMLAYSSVEHMGILALGVGLGGAGVFGSVLHAVNHSLTKAALFLVAGNILTAYGTKSVSEVRGVCRVLPLSGVLWVAGFLAITGSPPFGLFLSEFTILKEALDQGSSLIAVAYLALLALIMIGMASIVLPMAQGAPAGVKGPNGRRESWWGTAPPTLLCLLVLVLGIYVPPSLSAALHEVANSLGGR